ncbi:MAG: hypothetical protein Q8O93_00565 [bacterium]|nr:hypothetical protein [bacterium]
MAVLLSSAAILYYRATLIQMAIVFLATLAYLFHIRVMDEERDFKHDSKHHKCRPIQQGVILIDELKKINIFGLIIFIAAALVYGKSSILIATIALSYTFLASRDFFLGEKIRRKFFIYNAINMIQMVLLQLFIYAAFTRSLEVNQAMWLHLFFVIVNSIIMEVVRKIKIKSEESTGQDTYSGRIGFSKSLIMYLLLVIFDYLIFIWLLYSLTHAIRIYFLISLPIIIFSVISIAVHYRIRMKKSENALLLSAVVFYVVLNLIIYFFNSL